MALPSEPCTQSSNQIHCLSDDGNRVNQRAAARTAGGFLYPISLCFNDSWTLADIKHPSSRRELIGENLEAGCMHVGSGDGLSLDQQQQQQQKE